MPVTGTYGMLAEFDTADDLVAAIRETRGAGYTRVEAFSPYPLPGAAAALGGRRTGMGFLVLLGGLVGAATGFFMQYWVAALAYPLNVGGRPLNSWPVFIPITFELAVLTAAFAGFLGVLVLCRLPRYHHPLFGTASFARATSDGFYLCIEAADPKFDPIATREFLAALRATGIEEVTR